MHVELTKHFRIDAAHQNTSSAGKGARLHGHTFIVSIVVEGAVDASMGWLVDYGDIKALFRPIEAALDHHYVNEIPGMGDGSAAAIAAWIDARLRPALPCLKEVRVTIAGDAAFQYTILDASETEDLPERLGFSFEAAQQLPHLPPDHPCRRLHGHSYRVEIGAGHVEELMPAIREIYDELDHVCLNDIPGLEDATSERLCEWIWNRLAGLVDDMACVVVQETETARCIYRGR